MAFFFAFLVIDFLASALAFALERRRPDDKEDVWLLSQVWLQRFAYRQLFSVVLFKTLKRALEGRKFAWDKLERTAAVKRVAVGGSGSGERAVACRQIGRFVSEITTAQILPDFFATPSRYAFPAFRYWYDSRLWFATTGGDCD